MLPLLPTRAPQGLIGDEPSGYYGERTEYAVQKWQASVWTGARLACPPPRARRFLSRDLLRPFELTRPPLPPAPGLQWRLARQGACARQRGGALRAPVSIPGRLGLVCCFGGAQ